MITISNIKRIARVGAPRHRVADEYVLKGILDNGSHKNDKLLINIQWGRISLVNLYCFIVFL